jgi:hypothetical protein
MAQQIKKKFIDPTLISQIDEIESGLSQEVTDREAAVSALEGRLDEQQTAIDAVATDLATETTAREAALYDLEGRLSEESEARVQGDADTLQAAKDHADSSAAAVDAKVDDLAGVVQGNFDSQQEVAEGLRTDVDAAQAAVQALAGDVDAGLAAEASAREAAVTALQEAIDAEAAARVAADEEIQSQIDFIKDNTDPYALDSLSEIVSAFQTADEELNGAITSLAASKDEKIQEVKDDLAAETTAREAADTALGERIDSVEAALAAEVTAREAALYTLEGDLTARLEGLEEDAVTKTYVDEADAALAASIADEVAAREAALYTLAGDLTDAIETAKTNATSDANAYTDEKVSDLLGDAPAELDTLGKLATAVTESASAIEVLQGEGSELEGRVEALETRVETVFVDSFEALPPIGSMDKVYITKDVNKIYRFDLPEVELPTAPEEPEFPPFDVSINVSNSAELLAAVANAPSGDVVTTIYLNEGTYELNESLVLDKSVALIGRGETSDQVVLKDTRGNSQSFITVSADTTTLKNLTVEHVTTESNIGTAIIASGGGFPQARLNGFGMYDVHVKYSKAGLSVRSDFFVVRRCTFEVVAGSSTRRGILHYGNGGLSFIKDNHFINATTGALRAICPTSTSGSNPSDNLSGSLTIEGSTFTGNLSQFINMDNHQGEPGSFFLQIKDNITPETNAFFVSFGGADNFGDVFAGILLIGNTLTNNHAASGGKGAIAIDGINGPRPFRSSPLFVLSVNNTLDQTAFRVGYAEASGSSGGIIGYATAQINQPEALVAQSIEEVAVLSGSGQYLEVSQTIETDLSGVEGRIEALEAKFDQPAYNKMKVVLGENLAFIDLAHEAIQNSLVVSVGRAMVHLGDDFTVTVEGDVTRIAWTGSLAEGQAEGVEEGDTVFVTYAYLA